MFTYIWIPSPLTPAHHLYHLSPMASSNHRYTFIKGWARGEGVGAKDGDGSQVMDRARGGGWELGVKDRAKSGDQEKGPGPLVG